MMLWLALLLQPTTSFAADAFPTAFAPEAELRVFLKKGPDFALYLEGAGSFQKERRPVRALGGAYYRLHPNLRVGAFFQRQYGNVHDSDWNFGTGDWNDTRSRGENSVIGDVTPRLLLDFLPGSNWVGELKARIHHNLFNSQNTVTLRPGLTYFWLRDDEPFLNLFAQFELYLPLNYGHTTAYKQWQYLGAMYFWNSQVQTGLYASRALETWSITPTDQRDATSYAVGGFLVLQWDL